MRIKQWSSFCLWLMFVLWTSPSLTAELPAMLAECVTIADDARRLQCYDELAEFLPAVSKDDTNIPQIESSQEVAEEQPNTDIAWLGRKRKGYWLGIHPYRRNYILPITYNDLADDELYGGTGRGFRVDDVEIKYQFSFELPIWKGILDQDLDLYFAYTQLSFFQAYNQEYSSPFRDTVYEPELGLNWQPGLVFMDWRLNSARLMFNHQSNGRTEPLSRSWNRLIGQVEAEHGNLALGLRFWKRFEEATENDDNPDIIDYLGHGEVFASYNMGPHRFSLMLRNPIDHAAVQLDWSRLINERVRFYVQYFNGYGESLIDYDHQVNRLGIGFLLNEWP